MSSTAFAAFTQKRWAPVAVLAAVVALFFGPALLQPDKVIWSSSAALSSDISYRHWPDMIGYAASLREGRIALWDPLTVLGRPLAGDPIVLFMYPFSALFLIFPPALAFTVFDALHVFLAGLFTYLLLRVGYKTSREAALISGLAFAFMPKLMAHLAVGHVGLHAAMSWAPAVLLGLKLAFDGSLLAAALAGLALAIQIPTHMQEVYYAAAVGSALWLWQLGPLLRPGLRGDPDARRRVKRLVVVYAVWIAAFVLLSAVVLVPLIELLPYNSRTDFALADANVYALPPTLLLTLFAPGNFQLSEWVIFLGVVPSALALVGFLKADCREKWLWMFLIGFALIFALGTATPVFGLAFTYIPGFSLLRIPTRLWLFAGLAVAILAGLGAAQLASIDLRQAVERNRPRLLKAVGVYLAGGVAALVGYWAIFQHWHWLLTIQLLAVVGMVGAVAGWSFGKIDGRVLQWLLVPFVLVDLFPVAASYMALVDPRRTFLESTPEFDFVSSQPGLFRVHSPLGTLSFALAAERRVEILEGLLSFQIGHAMVAIREASGCTRPGYATSVPICLDDIDVPSGRPDAQRLGALNVRYVITPQMLPESDFTLVFSGEDRVYENLRWQPRARLLPEGTASITARRAGEYHITTDSPQPAALIVAETWLPGWQAAVDGQPVASARDEAFISVRVPAGVHQVQLRYDPWGWRLGWPVSALSLVGLGLWIGAALWRRRGLRPSTAPQAEP